MTRSWAGAAAFIALTLAATWPLATRLGSSLPGDYGDPLFVSFVMGTVARKLTAALTDPASLAAFWDAGIFFPEPQTLALSEHFTGQTVLALPVYWATHNLILFYNVVFLASFVLLGTGTMLLVRAVTGSAAAGLFAGAVAAFNEYRLVYEVAHLHTLSLYWFPFVLFGFHRYLVTERRRVLAGAALAWLALNLSSVYYLAYCAPFIACFTLAEIVTLGKWRRLRIWWELLAATAVVALLTAPFLVPYAAVQERLAIHRSVQELAAFSATLDHYRVALPKLLVPAGLAILSLAAAFAQPRRLAALSAVTFLMMALAIWLSLGPVIQAGGRPVEFPALYPLLAKLPGYDGLRVPARFASLFFLFLGVQAGLALGILVERRPRIGPALAAIALAMFLWQSRGIRVPLDQPLPSAGLQPPPAYLTPARGLPGIYLAVDGLSSSAVIAEFPFGDPWYELRYMFFAATHGRRLSNGYSGVFPPSYVERRRVLGAPHLAPAAAETALAGVTHVVVHAKAWPGDTAGRIAAWLETIHARPIAEADGARLYVLSSSR